MNNQNPTSSQDSLLEQKNTGRTRTKLVVSIVLALHCAVLLAFLAVGCKKEKEQEPLQPTEPIADTVATNAEPYFEPYTNAADTNFPAAMDSNQAPVAAMPDTNLTTLPPAPVALPSPGPAVPAVTGSATEYAVAKGDSFSTIAKKFGVSVRAITEANPNVVPTKLQIGQKLQIPAPSASAAPSVSADTTATAAPVAAATSSSKSYTVKSGDTLSKIATQHGTSIKALRSANNLKTDRIKVGQKLKIPAKAAAATTTAPAPELPSLPTAPPTVQQ